MKCVETAGVEKRPGIIIVADAKRMLDLYASADRLHVHMRKMLRVLVSHCAVRWVEYNL